MFVLAGLQTVLNFLLPLSSLLPVFSTQAVSPPTCVKVKEATIISFLGSSRWNTGWLGDSFHFTEVNRPLAVEVLSRIVVPQLVLDRVQDKPPLLPSFQKSTTLIQITLANDVRMLILMTGIKYIYTILLTKLPPSPSTTPRVVELVQIVRGWVPGH